MPLTVQADAGHAIPPAPRHSITVHLPLWSSLVRWVEGDVEVIRTIKSMYPRMMLHKDVKFVSRATRHRLSSSSAHLDQLANKVWEEFGRPKGQACLLFSSSEIAFACRIFALREIPGDVNQLSSEEVSIHISPTSPRLYAVFFPDAKRATIQPFWTHTGTGISSRLAEHCLKHFSVMEITPKLQAVQSIDECPAHLCLRKRIAMLLKRAPGRGLQSVSVSPEDVYLFPTGMAAIYALHSVLLQKFSGLTALIGLVFRSSQYLFENLGLGCKIFGSTQLAHFEAYLEDNCTKAGERPIQALWTEFPGNPMLTTADLKTLRSLANRYGFVLVVDDTIGSFCNVDILGVADIVITSLTKSFSGYADVMGGSIVLNPSSTKFDDLKAMVDGYYHNDYWFEDAEVMERNSRDYLSRSHVLNYNAERLVEALHSYEKSPTSTVRKVFYPTTNPDRAKYEEFMRQKTPDFVPGYGCLFTIELCNIEATIAFYDALPVYKGPHLGAHLTLAMPYVKGLYNKQLTWAANYGLKETQIRISVGLEDINVLLEAFELAIQVADATATPSPIITFC